MSLLRLLLANLLYHARGNSAVLLGVAVGCAVLTGALLVGDSLQGSLRAQALGQLGWVDQALVSPRFFREALAGDIARAADTRVCPVLLAQSTCVADNRTARGVNVLGLEASFFAPGSPPDRFGGRGTGNRPLAWLSQRLADALGVTAGDSVTLRLARPGEVPREAAFGKKEIAFDDWDLEVATVLDDDQPGARLSLRPQLAEPLNLLVALPHLQEMLGQPGRVNALLAAGSMDLSEAIRESLRMADWGLVLHTPDSRAADLIRRYDQDNNGQLDAFEWRDRRIAGRWTSKYAWIVEEQTRPASQRVRTVADLRDYYRRQHPYLALEGKQLLLSAALASAAQEAAQAVGLRSAPTFVYLCRLDQADRRTAGVVAALDATLPAPLGPFLPASVASLAEDQILLLEPAWEALGQPAVGSTITLRFKPPESHGPAPDQIEKLQLAGIVPASGVALDPGLTPEFPGITDRDDVGAWDLPFDDDDWKRNIAREYGDLYWKRYRSAPRAFVSLALGKRLWSSRFGELTSIRLAPEQPVAPEQLTQLAQRYEQALLQRLSPAQGGFVFEPVRTRALEASRGGTPFGLLFLGFSFFLILSALLLVGLLYRLNLDRRARQIGVLFAVGYPHASVRSLLLGEAGLLALLGVAVGCAIALLYSALLVQLLAALWPGGVLRSLLQPYWTWTSLLAGAMGALLVSLLTVAWVVRQLGKVPPRALLTGQTGDESQSLLQPASKRLWIGVLLCLVLAGVLLLVGPQVPGHEARAGTFFGSGALFLTAGLMALFAWMKRTRSTSFVPTTTLAGYRVWWTIAQLGVRNAARHPSRSLLTVGLLAFAAFLLVAVESFRRRATEGDGSITAPDGGFALIGESDIPIIRDLNSAPGRRELLDRLRQRYTERGLPTEEVKRKVDADEQLLQQTKIVALRARAGDDASCQNLYQAGQPRLLGVPRSLIERGGFVFESSRANTPEQKANPWLVLLDDSQGIPAVGEANTLLYQLKIALGADYPLLDDQGVEHRLRIAGAIKDSVFQSALLVSEENFLRLFPGHEGYHFFLIAPPAGQALAVRDLLQAALEDRGFAVTLSVDRLAAYQAIESTYLTTFQALGGLGLLLGSLGLAVVLLRSVWERQSELALLQALGYPKITIGWLVLAENGFLLFVGLVVGTLSALLSILPQLLSGQGSVPVVNLLLLFAVVLLTGLAAGTLAVVWTLRSDIVPALRRE